MRPAHLDRVLHHIDRTRQSLAQLKGVLESLANDEKPIVRNHLTSALVGWRKRIMTDELLLLRHFDDLFDDLAGH